MEPTPRRKSTRERSIGELTPSAAAMTVRAFTYFCFYALFFLVTSPQPLTLSPSRETIVSKKKKKTSTAILSPFPSIHSPLPRHLPNPHFLVPSPHRTKTDPAV